MFHGSPTESSHRGDHLVPAPHHLTVYIRGLHPDQYYGCLPKEKGKYCPTCPPTKNSQENCQVGHYALMLNYFPARQGSIEFETSGNPFKAKMGLKQE